MSSLLTSILGREAMKEALTAPIYYSHLKREMAKTAQPVPGYSPAPAGTDLAVQQDMAAQGGPQDIGANPQQALLQQALSNFSRSPVIELFMQEGNLTAPPPQPGASPQAALQAQMQQQQQLPQQGPPPTTMQPMGKVAAAVNYIKGLSGGKNLIKNSLGKVPVSKFKKSVKLPGIPKSPSRTTGIRPDMLPVASGVKNDLQMVAPVKKR